MALLSKEQMNAEIARKNKAGIPLNYGIAPKPQAATAVQQAAPNYGQQPLSQNPQQSDLAMRMQRYGVDPALFGPNVTKNQAYANAGQVGTPTADVQKSLFDTLMSTASAYGAMPTGTAAQAANLPLFEGISNYLKPLEGRKYQGTIEHDDAQQNTANSNALGWSNNGLAGQDNVLAQDKFDWEKKKTKATAGWTADALGYATKAEAIQFIADNAEAIAADGVNPNDVRSFISEQFETNGTGANDPAQREQQLNDQATNDAISEYKRVATANAKAQADNAVPGLPENMKTPMLPVKSLEQLKQEYLAIAKYNASTP